MVDILNSTLERLTRHTGVDFHGLKNSFSWLFSAQIVATATGLLLTILLANLLSEVDYGTYKYLMTLAGLVGVLSLSGVKTSATRAIAQGYEAEIHRAVHKILRWSGGMLFVALGLASYYLYMGNTTLGYGALALMLVVPVDIAYSSFSVYLNGKQLYKQFTLLGIIYTSLPLILTSVTLYISRDPLTLFLVFMISQALIAFILYKYTLYRFKPNKNSLDGTARYGAHLSFMNILGGASTHFDKLLTWHFLGPVQLAAYSVILAAPQQLKYFNKIINTLALPRFSNRSVELLRRTVWRKLLVIFTFSLVLLVIPYWFAAPYIFEYVFPKYVEYTFMSQVLSLTLLFMPTMLLVNILKAHEQTKSLYVLQTGLPVVKLISLFFLIPTLGIWGIIISHLFLRFIRFFLGLSFFLRMPRKPSS